MDNLMNTSEHRLRKQLLVTASVFALLGLTCGAEAADSDRPPLWIEFGGQLERLSGTPAIAAPPFFSLAPSAVLTPMIAVQKPSLYGFGENGKISFAPGNSEWIFSAAFRYGRSNTTKHRHYESAHAIVPFTDNGVILTGQGVVKDRLGDGQGGTKESHLVLDFTAGKDVGLGMFGAGSSVLSAGVRFAQFTAGMHATLHARPTYASGPFFSNVGKYRVHGRHFQSNTAVIQSKRDTHAVGPAVSWDASLPLAGNASGAAFTLDWGVNAALLFGRQRAHVHHQTKGYYFKGFITYNKYKHGYSNPPVNQTRSRSVTIPNIGGFMGASLKFPNAKVSLGYRGDFFFGAMDDGWDTRKSGTRGFYGPFASISVGLGN